ncbi:hypothetical protein DFA_05902 [Cavenderia fasciculata]|uniref:Major facilitator superfamily (MFS) profile domain-containing protein n=1 Tax=Cavenderia fasciculata TaxID=261658 RepID=F4PJJ3_CACFS|nr:uncharacterized protein DFA_05902 [Cavenderia fasciculata]EGG23767.1 hypothetical protein DFA_05902 [Cavenderia fasciculata]|eukprot:XP_004361618.1 hypothetical protein DFA_05902 [Cavenderia fasciculata]
MSSKLTPNLLFFVWFHPRVALTAWRVTHNIHSNTLHVFHLSWSTSDGDGGNRGSQLIGSMVVTRKLHYNTDGDDETQSIFKQDKDQQDSIPISHIEQQQQKEEEEEEEEEDEDSYITFIDQSDETQSQTLSFPPSIRFLIGSDIFERYTFNSVRSIMVMFLINFYGYNNNDATSILHAFIFITFLFPVVIGGYLADGVIGKYKTTLYFMVMNCMGSILLFLSTIPASDNPNSRNPFVLLVGLVLLSFGTGAFRPVFTAFIGDQLDAKTQGPLVGRLYTFYMWGLNLGFLLSSIVSPLIGAKIGYQAAFLVPCLFNFASIALLLLGEEHYQKRPISGSIFISAFKIISFSIFERFKNILNIKNNNNNNNNNNPSLPPLNEKEQENVNNNNNNNNSTHWLDTAKSKYDHWSVESLKASIGVLACFIPLPFYRAMTELTASRWVLQALSMNRNIGGWFMIQPDQIQAFKPLLMISLIPISGLIFKYMDKKGIEPRPLQKVGIGLFTSIVAMIMCTLLQIHIDHNPPNSVPLYLQVPQFVVLALAELLISIPLLHFSYKYSAASHKSLIMSAHLISISLGSLIVLLVVDVLQFSVQWHEYLLYAALTLLFSLLFVFIAKRFQPPPLESSILNYQDD